MASNFNHSSLKNEHHTHNAPLFFCVFLGFESAKTKAMEVHSEWSPAGHPHRMDGHRMAKVVVEVFFLPPHSSLHIEPFQTPAKEWRFEGEKGGKTWYFAAKHRIQVWRREDVGNEGTGFLKDEKSWEICLRGYSSGSSFSLDGDLVRPHFGDGPSGYLGRGP